MNTILGNLRKLMTGAEPSFETVKLCKQRKNFIQN